MENKNNYLFVDDIFDASAKTIPKEFLDNISIPQRGKIISGILGTFNIKDMEG